MYHAEGSICPKTKFIRDKITYENWSNMWNKLVSKHTGIDIFPIPAWTEKGWSSSLRWLSGETGHAVGSGSNSCGASLSDTIHFNSDAAGNCWSLNFLKRSKMF